MATTTTKNRPTQSRSAFEGLEELDRLVKEAEEIPAQIQEEHRAAVGDLAVVRRRLQGSYSVPADQRDPDFHASLMQGASDAEKVADRRWDDESLGALVALERAQEAVERYIDTHFDALAAETVARATQVRADKIAAIEALAATLVADSALRQTWQRILGPKTGGAGGVAQVHKRLLGYEVPHQHTNTVLALGAIQNDVDVTIQRLNRIDLANLRRIVPPELDVESGGVDPVGAA